MIITKSKKGFQLSMNFIVSIILALVLFGLAVAFFGDIMKSTTDFSKWTMDDLDKRMSLISCGQAMVCVGPSEKEVGIGKLGVFTVHLFNGFANDKILVKVTLTPKPDASSVLNILYGSDSGQQNSRETVLDAGEQADLGVGIVPKKGVATKGGIYIIDVKTEYCTPNTQGVCTNYQPFADSRYKIKVVVP